MIVAPPPGLTSRRTAWSVALACLVLTGCAEDMPPSGLPQPAPAPMVTPQSPPSSPEFNAQVAKPLPVPEPPSLRPLAAPAAPGPLTRMTPLPRPEPLVLSAMPVLEPNVPAALAKPIPRPTSPPPSMTEAPTATPESAATTQESAAPASASAEAGVGGGYRLLFEPGARELPAAATALLHEVAESMGREPLLRLKIAAYASGDPENPVPARRLSLQRALKVREALAGEGIVSLRVDILALGLNAPAPPNDRVDLIPVR